MIQTSNLLAIADNIAKTLLDLESAYISNPATNSPTVNTITNGLTATSSSLESRVAALANIQQEADLALATSQAATNVQAYMAITPQQLYVLYASLMIALDHHTAGLNSYLTNNAVQVHSEFANAFNYIALNAPSLGITISALAIIQPANIFVPTTQTLGSIAVTGATTGNFTPGSSISSTRYAAGQLYLTNSGASPSTGTSTSFLVTYVNTSGATTTATVTLLGALAAGTSLIISGAIGFSVSGVLVTANGANGDQFSITVPPARQVSY